MSCHNSKKAVWRNFHTAFFAKKNDVKMTQKHQPQALK